MATKTKQQYLVLPLSPAYKRKVRAAAKRNKLSMSAWMRTLIDSAK